MKSTLLLLSCLCTSLAFAHIEKENTLAFSDGMIEAQTTWENGPHTDQESLMVIKWKNAIHNTPIDLSDSFEVILWMPSMGHGSAPTQIQSVLDDKGNVEVGVYRVSNIHFIMGGDWEVRIVLNHSNGEKEIQVISFDLPGGGHHHHKHN